MKFKYILLIFIFLFVLCCVLLKYDILGYFDMVENKFNIKIESSIKESVSIFWTNLKDKSSRKEFVEEDTIYWENNINKFNEKIRNEYGKCGIHVFYKGTELALCGHYKRWAYSKHYYDVKVYERGNCIYAEWEIRGTYCGKGKDSLMIKKTSN